MLDLIFYNVSYEMIDNIGINNMWKIIYNLGCANKLYNKIMKERIQTIYFDTIVSNIRITGENKYILPSLVLAKIYPNNITVSKSFY